RGTRRAGPRGLGEGSRRVAPEYRSSGSGRGGRGSEVEVVDVAGVEDGGLAEADHAVLADGVLTHRAGLEGLALLAGDPAGGESDRGARGQFAQLGRVPPLER